MTIKASIASILKKCPPLFRFGSKVYHKINGSFKTLSEGTPEAIREAFKLALSNSKLNNSKLNNTNKPLGDYYEFGLFRGYAFLKAFEYSKELGVDNINFYGFDSFEGLPEAVGIDKADGRFFEGQFSCSKENVEKNLQSNGMDMSRTALIEGFYSDSLTEELRTKHSFNEASVVLLDCDLYSSTMEALDWLMPYLNSGTILLFDDWYSYGESDQLGQQKAMKDFLEKNKQFNAKHLWEFSNNGNAFILESA